MEEMAKAAGREGKLKVSGVSPIRSDRQRHAPRSQRKAPRAIVAVVGGRNDGGALMRRSVGNGTVEFIYSLHRPVQCTMYPKLRGRMSKGVRRECGRMQRVYSRPHLRQASVSGLETQLAVDFHRPRDHY